MAIGADCSMRLGSARYTAQQRVQFDESGQGDLRCLGQAHVDASFPLGHPFRDDDESFVGRDAHEGSVAGGRAMSPGHGQRLAAEAMPRVVDDDRS
jgi:hypothetical protein